MSARDDGGHAFPGQPIFHHPHGATSMSAQDGMTLRDWFAGQMAAGVFMQVYSDKLSANEPAQELHRLVASASYKVADALLKERSK